ncbi:hypothetical protein SDC9_106940 [bioreactor metagenome]|uniref:Uncharacterized protein n=1 Tax=bioreactor metagenome TaxID=1076179 RepID=A0A645BAB5_9ZZZZ
MHRALLTYQQASAQLGTRGAQRKSGQQLAAIGNAARRNDRQPKRAHRVHHLRYQRHCGQLAHMAARLGALGDHAVNAQRGKAFCQHRRGDDWENLDARRFPRRDKRAGVARAGRDDGHLLFDDHLRHRGGFGVHQHNIDAKRFACQLFAAADLLPQCLGGHAAPGDQPQRAGV